MTFPNLRQKHSPTVTAAAATMSGPSLALYVDDGSSRLWRFVAASLGLHVGVIGTAAILTWLIALILMFLGIEIPKFDPLAAKQRDIEFVLVDNPTAPPIDKNTRNRADRATRAGGPKIPNMRQAESQRLAGPAGPKSTPSPAPRPQPQPARQAARPTPQPSQRPAPRPQPATRPAQPTQRVAQQQTAPTPVPRRSPAPQPPAPQPTPQPPAPPAPRVNRTELAQARPVLPPNPVAAPIRMPQPPAPRSIATGPIINTPGVGGGSRSAGGSDSGSPGPSQVPGAVSGGGGSFGGGAYGGPSGRGGRAGGAGGAGGSGSFNQYGSGSGSGGRSGVDALPDTDFGPYIAELQRRIKRNWNPPSDSRSKRIVAIFTIGKDGRLLSVRLRAPSGVKLADDAALAAVRASAPFRPLPATFRNDEVDVEFTFDYSVYSSGGVGGGHVRP